VGLGNDTALRQEVEAFLALAQGDVRRLSARELMNYLVSGSGCISRKDGPTKVILLDG
jgi:hypothetical protein